MVEPLYPYGYTPDAHGVQGMGTMLTRAECEAKQTVHKLHPEFWRRTIALMEFAYQAGVPLGVGTGWRVQPNPPPPGFAPPGNSNHEGFPADGSSGGAVAIDTVPDRSWAWMETRCAQFGLRTFRDVNDEPWHIQPIEIPAGRNWRTEPWQLEPWPLPGDEEEPDMPLTDEDIARIWAYPLKGGGDLEEPAGWWLTRIHGIVRRYLGGFKNAPPDDPTMLKDIYTNTKGEEP